MKKNIDYQLPLMLPFPTVYGPKEYTELRDTLIHMNTLLDESHLEIELIVADLEKYDIDDPSPHDIENRRKMIRCSILKVLSGLDYREFSIRLAESELYQWFARYNRVGKIKTPSKSTLERFCKHFEFEQIRCAIDSLNKFMSKKENAQKFLDEEAIYCDAIFADSTCVKAHIHFPVDWVLLRDTVRTLTKAIICIRNQGFKHRMPPPEDFISTINSLCMQMSSSRRKQDVQKKRKQIFRKMKKVSKTIELHARRYYDLLSKNWEVTDWSYKQTQVVLKRIQNILDKLPQATRQAHERIIGERKVKTADKLLSMYEDDIHVIVRGKADAEVEFGNGLYLAEQENGIIVDFDFFQDQPPNDSSIVKSSIERITATFGKPIVFTTDRGFSSKKNSDYLEEKNIYNGMCPRSVSELRSRLRDDEFVFYQRRRAQTEGRIGIFKNVYLRNPLRCKGFTSRRKFIALGVFTHNLWRFSCMAREAEYERLKAAA